MINNLKEFIEARGFEWAENSMYQYGRALYKYTFGPWVSYLVELEPAREVKFNLNVFRGHDGNARFVITDDFPERMKQFFDMDETTEFEKYCEQVVNFKQEHEVDWDYQLLSEEIEEDDPRLIIFGTYKFQPKCATVYYEDTDASTGTLHYANTCYGIRVGSIVEGCDFDAPPFELVFPFEEEQYEKELTALENYVDAAWTHCNSTWYKVENGDETLWCTWTQFDDNPTGNFEEVDGDALAIARAAGELLFNGGEGEVPGFPGWVVREEEPIGFEY